VTDAVHAEWTKLRTIAGTWWLMASAVAVAVGASAGIAASTHVSPGGLGGAGQDPTKLALIGVDLGQAVVAVLAILAVTEEYGSPRCRAAGSCSEPKP
jgi:ABC-2 type transport system permease protein